MAAGTEEKEFKFLSFNPVNQQPIRFSEALAEAFANPCRIAIPIFFSKRFLTGGTIDHLSKFVDMEVALFSSALRLFGTDLKGQA